MNYINFVEVIRSDNKYFSTVPENYIRNKKNRELINTSIIFHFNCGNLI